MASRVRLVISRLVLIFVLPLDFHGGVRLVMSMYLLAALRPGHGPNHLLAASVAEIGFRWDPLTLWPGLGLDYLSLAIWLALFNFLRLLFLMPGGTRLQLIFVVGKGFGEGPCWMFMALCSSLTLHVRDRDKGLLRSILVGGVWNGYLHGKVRGQHVPCRFCVAPDNDGHLFC